MIRGFVLCGGRSSRMGTDKALLPVQGVAMARRVADALLAGGCESVRAIGGDTDALAEIGLEVVSDGWPGEGPLGGVLTALQAVGSSTDVAVVLACDLPHITGGTVSALVAALAGHPGAAVAVAETDRLQPMCAVWRPAAEPLLRDALASGERRLHAVVTLPTARAVRVPVPEQDLLNINAPGDLGSSV